MTLTIELTPDEEMLLADVAQRELIEPEALVRKLISNLRSSPAKSGIAENSSADEMEKLLSNYHALLDRKFTVGLTDAEAAQLAILTDEIYRLDSSNPREQHLDTLAEEEHARKIAVLDNAIQLLQSMRP